MATCLFPVSQALRGHHGDDQAPTDLVDYAQLDAFTSEPFRGNPAAVCLLPIARSKEWMQNVAAEFSAPMTAFLVKRTSSFANGTSNGEDAPNGHSTAGELHAISEEKASEFDVRFFTPMAEVDLCGHATLASAYLMFKSNLAPGTHVFFHTSSATLKVNKLRGEDGNNEWQGQVELSLPFMDSSPASIDTPSVFPQTLKSSKAISAHNSIWDRLILELPCAADVETLAPCFQEIAQCGMDGGVIVTAKGTAASPFDFVSRFFAPQLGIPEDPVCGTAHCALAPFWAAKLGKKKLLAYQASKRGGVLELCVDEDARRVLLRGTAVIVSTGVLLS
ncbi:hypothetical protein KC19_10G039600 [Ceratodon purpureus]|uniref:Uncharacterized protein n=1 Tax=Ceratodon purpureus TaxID=3225 RepID=A0A8T0GGM6_CERPU|nr:hypothetical protein KC19_10G039600 [Ceratodon purpureus]